ncbi:MAG: hypothetical protein WAK17_12350 [Candidatus Nitrosopolaris sp.]|jgi:hypothetical protein
MVSFLAVPFVGNPLVLMADEFCSFAVPETMTEAIDTTTTVLNMTQSIELTLNNRSL